MTGIIRILAFQIGSIVATVTLLSSLTDQSTAQETSTPNGIADNRAGAYALTNAQLYQSDGSYRNGSLLIRNGRIVSVQDNDRVPDGFFAIDLDGKYLYPGLIDIYTDLGMPELESIDNNGAAENLFPSNGALNANDAIRANFRASTSYRTNENAVRNFRELGFSTVLSHRADGIARGTSALITLGDQNANEAIILPDVAAHYSLDKGSSTQSMPTSLMGSFALIRQTFLDAAWFTQQQPRPFTDDTLEAWQATQSLPQIMEVENWQQALTADKVGDEFDTQYILKTAGDSYKRADLIAATDASLIVPLNFPEAPEVTDPIAAEDVSLDALKHWELAPFNARLLVEADIEFALTSGADPGFWSDLREAVASGLSEADAINALTSVPAAMLGASDQIGSLRENALANFLITNGPLLDEGTVLLENWIVGERYLLNEDFDSRAGRYQLNVGSETYELSLTVEGAEPSAELLLLGDQTRPVNLELGPDLITLSFVYDEEGNQLRLTGWSTEQGWQGNAYTPAGELVSWSLGQRGVPDSASSPRWPRDQLTSSPAGV